METEMLDLVSEFAELLEEWKKEDSNNRATLDCLRRMAQILETSVSAFYALEADLLDPRTSVSALSDCAYAQLLSSLESDEEIIEKIISQMTTSSDFSFKCHGARVLFNVMMGSKPMSEVLEDSEAFVAKLYDWCKDGKEPLCSYAAGLLGMSMELSKCVSLFDSQNSDLVSGILAKLKYLKNIPKLNTPAIENYDIPPPKVRRGSGQVGTPDGYNRTRVDTPLQSATEHASDLTPRERRAQKRQSLDTHCKKACIRSSDYSLFPLTVGMQQKLMLRCLQPLGLYQELLQVALEHNVIELVMHYINIKKQKDAYLALEGLKYIGSLLCHKKLGVDFIAQGGIARIVEIPRQSLVSTGISLCLYVIVYNKDAMEKVCLLPHAVLSDLVKYALWLLERSHDSARYHATLFFTVAFSYRGVLDLFDQMDGLRILANLVSTLEILQVDVAPLLADNDDQIYNSRKTIRHTCMALGRYFEMHVAIAAYKIQQFLSRYKIGIAHPPPILSYEAYATNFESVLEAVDFLFEHNAILDTLPCMKHFVKLKGLQTVLQIIGIASKWKSSSYKTDVISAAISCVLLLMCTIKAQHGLEMPVSLSATEKELGMRLMLRAALGQLVDDADVMKSALRAICHCCMPVAPAGNRAVVVDFQIHKALQLPHQLGDRMMGRTRSDVDRMQALIRQCNGIDALLFLLDVTSPLTDADAIRALACRGLYYLSESVGIRQILGKLTIFQSEKLQQLMREPVLSENAAEHTKFCHFASLLIEKTTGSKFLDQASTLPIWSRLARANVVSETRINYPNKDLLTLINEHLLSNGLIETAKVLQKEANLSQASSAQNSEALLRTPKQRPMLARMSPSLRGSPQFPHAMSTPLQSGLRESSVNCTSGMASALSDADQQVTLDNIVTHFLREQHAQCRNPVKTCPPFSLLRQHKCPEPRHRRNASANITCRIAQRQASARNGGREGALFNRKLIYSRFKPVSALRDTEDRSYFTCVSFVPNTDYAAIGTYDGVIQLYNLKTNQQETTYQMLTSTITNCEISKDGRLMIASSSHGYPMSGVWSLSGLELGDRVVDMPEDHFAMFSNDQEKFIGTQHRTANVYDLFTGKRTASLREPNDLNGYVKNLAVFNPTDDLVLNDGCMWDLREPRMIHQFDKLDYFVSGVFNPSGLEIIVGSQIWDMRTFRLLRTVPALDRSQIKFNRAGTVLFSLKHSTKEEDLKFCDDHCHHMGPFASSFRTFDASEYSSIGIVMTKKTILDLAVDHNDLHVAVIENAGQPHPLNEESVCRLYEVGRQRRVSGEESDDEDQDEDGDERLGSDNYGDDDDEDDDDNDEDDIADYYEDEGGFSDDDDSSIGDPFRNMFYANSDSTYYSDGDDDMSWI